ncbi:transposable element Tcb2 transposase [Trichonephila clavipes]|nr:transposable element Tcb2 transposase [Trichonephila clavipes]
MVWVAIMLDGRTPLHVFESGTVTGVSYMDEVLESYVHLFRCACSLEFILDSEDSDKESEFLESEDIHRMDMPTRSPNFNPIEHVWDTLAMAI